ncbi:MAG TPA: LuxR C-terminal-related transcriptional regulator [Terriglobales bacterium]|nr:LuxR C-terminal-related transcriptional regulator [Terriglobales bacterium]
MSVGTSHAREQGVSGKHAPPSGGKALAIPALGFLVTDDTLRSLSANHEAMRILTYAAKQAPQSLTQVFDEKIRRVLLRGRVHLRPNTLLPVIPFKSGRRVYFCRAFRLDANVNPRLLIVLERGIPESFALSQVSLQFRLTQREQEAVTFLLRGLSNKEMAKRMAVSPNTVKAFLRMVRVKMGVPTRAGILAKVLGSMLTPCDSSHPPASSRKVPIAQDRPIKDQPASGA